MLTAFAFAGLGLVLGVGYRKQLLAGRWRRDDDPRALPSFGWVLLVTPVVMGWIGHHVSMLSWWAVPAYVVLAALGVLLAAIDSDVHRLPDKLTLWPLPVLAGLLVIASAGLDDWSRVLRAGACGVAVALAFLVLALAAPSGLGLGDVKLALLLSFTLGWLGVTAVATWLFFGFLAGGLWALALLVTRRATRKTYIAFGPPLLLGALPAILGVVTL